MASSTCKKPHIHGVSLLEKEHDEMVPHFHLLFDVNGEFPALFYVMSVGINECIL